MFNPYNQRNQVCLKISRFTLPFHSRLLMAYIPKIYSAFSQDPGDSTSVSFAKTKESTKNSRGHEDVSPVRTSTRKGVLGTTGGIDMTPPPWKANDRKPTDIVRYNFLDNDDTDKSQFLFAEKRSVKMRS